MVKDSSQRAWTLQRKGQIKAALEMCERLLEENPDNVGALSCRATSEWAEGFNLERPFVDLYRAMELAPDNAGLRQNLASTLASKGDMDAAREQFLKAMELDPKNMGAFSGYAQNNKFTEETDLIRDTFARYAEGRMTKIQRELACFGLAKAYDDIGQYERAIHLCLEGNWIAHRPYPYDKEKAIVQAVADLETDNWLADVPKSTVKGPTPIFIVGMPRSGTTLTETIFSRHSAVHALGEAPVAPSAEGRALALAQQLGGDVSNPILALRSLTREHLNQEAEGTQKHIAEHAPEKFRFWTDKLPGNTQRIGLISKLYPHAKIIWVRRHPLDNAVSNLFARFEKQLNFAFNQDALGTHIGLVSQIMKHWKNVVELPIYDLSYERLVGDPETVMREMLEFVGLPWEDACLNPEQANRRIRTASQWQVRQPINKRSTERWRRYGDWLSPTVDALGGMDWINAEMADAGVDVDANKE